MASAANSTSVRCSTAWCPATSSRPRLSTGDPGARESRLRPVTPDDAEQWSSIGLTSLFYWSIGLLPFKDDFWSETDEPGNHWGGTEVDPELQTLVSSLIAGPVGPADAIGKLNRTRVMQACRADRTLLKPHAPAMNWTDLQPCDGPVARELRGRGVGLGHHVRRCHLRWWRGTWMCRRRSTTCCCLPISRRLGTPCTCPSCGRSRRRGGPRRHAAPTRRCCRHRRRRCWPVQPES